MATSTSYSFDLQRDQIIRTAMRLAGPLGIGAEPTADDIAACSDLLNLGLKALQTEAAILRSVERVTATLTSGTASYTASADTIDVEGPAYVTSTSSTTDSRVDFMSRDEYMIITDKTIQGRPSRMYVEKANASLVIYLYPVPDTTVTSLTYARVRLLKDMDSGTVTADLMSRWGRAVTCMLAHDVGLAYGMPLDRIAYLKTEFQTAKALALSDDAERGPSWFHIAHRGNAWPRGSH